jgi:hypothetical protein
MNFDDASIASDFTGIDEIGIGGEDFNFSIDGQWHDRAESVVLSELDSRVGISHRFNDRPDSGASRLIG